MMVRLARQMDAPHNIRRPAFVAESTLGKLAKWLRLAGFDTRYDDSPPDWRRLRAFAEAEDRVVLSRTRRVIGRLREGQGLLIRFDAPVEQMRQVITYYHIRPGDLEPLSRCLRCNTRLRPADRAQLQNAVPDYVRQHHVRFMSCARCGNIYWPGSHSSRMADQIQRWFDSDVA